MFEPFHALGAALGFVLGLVAHEYVTHLVAARMGDPSPRFQGRISFDLRRHADLLGTWVAPIFFVVVTALGNPPSFYFAFGKPHAIQAAYQRGPAKRVVISALAGPVAMLALAAVLARFAGIGSDVEIMFTFAVAVLLNMTAVELLPMPGRDGGRVLARFLSPQVALKYEELRQYEAVFVIAIYLLFPRVVFSISDGLGGLIS
jgi:Zn-dependent protease